MSRSVPDSMSRSTPSLALADSKVDMPKPGAVRGPGSGEIGGLSRIAPEMGVGATESSLPDRSALRRLKSHRLGTVLAMSCVDLSDLQRCTLLELATGRAATEPATLAELRRWGWVMARSDELTGVGLSHAGKLTAGILEEHKRDR